MVSALPCRSSGGEACACSMQHGLASAMVPAGPAQLGGTRSALLPWNILDLYLRLSLQSPHLLCWQPMVAILVWRKWRPGFLRGMWQQVLWIEDTCSALKEEKLPAGSRYKNLEVGMVFTSSFQACLRPCHWCSAFCCVFEPPSTQCLRCCPCCAIHVSHRHYFFSTGKTTTTKSCFFHFLLLQSFF